MKAAIVRSKGSPPGYGDIADPQPEKNHHIVNVKASALSRLARHRAAGTHYIIFLLPVYCRRGWYSCLFFISGSTMGKYGAAGTCT